MYSQWNADERGLPYAGALFGFKFDFLLYCLRLLHLFLKRLLNVPLDNNSNKPAHDILRFLLKYYLTSPNIGVLNDIYEMKMTTMMLYGAVDRQYAWTLYQCLGILCARSKKYIDKVHKIRWSVIRA